MPRFSFPYNFFKREVFFLFKNMFFSEFALHLQKKHPILRVIEEAANCGRIDRKGLDDGKAHEEDKGHCGD